MTLLDSHLEQIALSSNAIAELPFPPPQIFTNALLNTNDITALIRDTEPHERALFSPDPQARVPRRTTTNLGQAGSSNVAPDRFGIKSPRQSTATATLLGKGLGDQIRSEASRGQGDVDIEVLIKGAERLCGIYPLPGAKQRIDSQRSRLHQLTASIDRYESRVSSQAGQLAKINKAKRYTGELDEGDNQIDGDDGLGAHEVIHSTTEDHLTVADLEREEEEIRELENRKRLLEDRVSGMERDLGGLLR